MHEKLPMSAYPSPFHRAAPDKGRDLGLPALLIVLGMLLAYGGGLVRTQADERADAPPVSIETTANAASTLAQ